MTCSKVVYRSLWPRRMLHCNQTMRDDVHVAFHTCKYVCSIMVFTGFISDFAILTQRSVFFSKRKVLNRKPSLTVNIKFNSMQHSVCFISVVQCVVLCLLNFIVASENKLCSHLLSSETQNLIFVLCWGHLYDL